MSDVEAAAFSKPGQKITIQYGATPATVEKVGNTPAKPKQNQIVLVHESAATD